MSVYLPGNIPIISVTLSHHVTSVVVRKVQQSPGVLEAGPGVLGVPDEAEEHGAGGQRGSGLPRQVRTRPTLTEAEGWPGVLSYVIIKHRRPLMTHLSMSMFSGLSHRPWSAYPSPICPMSSLSAV